MLLATGCGSGNERDPGEVYTGANASTANNVNVAKDAGMDADAPSVPDAEIGDVASSVDAPPDEDSGGGDLPRGQTCVYPDSTAFDGRCDPVRNTGCTDPQVCVLVIEIVGPDANASSDCRDPGLYTVPSNTMCDPGEARCEATSTCISFYDTCLPLCFTETAEGCQPDEFCRRASSGWGGLGFCDTTCNQ